MKQPILLLVLFLGLCSAPAQADSFRCDLSSTRTLVPRGENGTTFCGQVKLRSGDSPKGTPDCRLAMSIQYALAETWLTLDQLHHDGTINREATLVYPSGHPPKHFSIKVATSYGMATAQCASNN
jgi:hypothetical protein